MLLPLDVAIYFGVVLALFLALRKASTPTLVEYVFDSSNQLAERNARHLDATTVFALRGLLDYLRQTQRHLLISGVHGDVLRVLRNSGLLAQLGAQNVFPAELNPNLATRKALQHARTLLARAEPDIRIFYDDPKNLPSAAAIESPLPAKS